MNECNLNGACMYIKDFVNWYSKVDSPQDVIIFVKDRFSECSENKKEELYEIFNKLSTKISDDGKLNSDVYDIIIDLMKVL